jgi:hypothetical protein
VILIESSKTLGFPTHTVFDRGREDHCSHFKTAISLKLPIEHHWPIGIGGPHEYDKENLFSDFVCFDAGWLDGLCKRAGIFDEGGRE